MTSYTLLCNSKQANHHSTRPLSLRDEANTVMKNHVIYGTYGKRGYKDEKTSKRNLEENPLAERVDGQMDDLKC